MRKKTQNTPLFSKIKPIQNTGENLPVWGLCRESKLPPNLAEKMPFSGVYLGSNGKYSALQQWRGFQPIGKLDSAALKSLQNSTSKNAQKVDFLTGEILSDLPLYDPVYVRLERYALQSAVRRLLPNSSTAKCLRLHQKHAQDIQIWRSIKQQSAFYVGLQHCGSVWNCPCCAAKISERRRIELLQAMDKHKANGGQVLLLTLTNPHTLTDDLVALLKAQALAMSRFNGDKAAKKLWASIGCIGTVRAWEVTHGVTSGWHPHFHLLLFVDSGLDLVSLHSQFYDLWANCCRLAKLPIPSFEHGVRLDDGSKASEYVSKGLWGLEREMTKGHIKKAKKGRSPFDLLRSYMNDKDRQAGVLFREYASAFKGKRQLVWSNGLKALFCFDEVSDVEILERADDEAIFFASLSFADFLLIRKSNLRGELLEFARLGLLDAIELCLIGLRKNEKQTE